jgi:hypothetical protein
MWDNDENRSASKIAKKIGIDHTTIERVMDCFASLEPDIQQPSTIPSPS